MKRLLGGVAVLLVLLFAVLAIRAWLAGAPPPAGHPPSLVDIDRDAALGRFSEALRIRTISHGEDSGLPRDDAAFRRFQQHLARSYPRVHVALTRELVAEHTLLYTWSGSDVGRAPVVLMGHYDVVPVADAALAHWTHPPFAGVVADDFIWGRGAFDDKINVIGLMEAAEALLREGFAPERTVHLSFGHDEEIGGWQGAAGVVALLRERGVRPALVLDEGGAIASGAVPGLERPVASVGIGEKGFVNVTLTVEAAGGHASAPPRHTAVGILATAIHRLERSPMPNHFGSAMRLTIEGIGPHLDFPFRLVTQNLWLFGPVMPRALELVPDAGPMLRTTSAATMFDAGVKPNALPNRASAVLNFRIFPGDSIDDIVAHVRRTVADDRVSIALSDEGRPREASSVSSLDTEAFALLRDTMATAYPDAIVGVPMLIPGGSDARHFRAISDGVFGFSPVRASIAELKRAHGNDERISVDSFVEGVGFYAELMRRAGRW